MTLIFLDFFVRYKCHQLVTASSIGTFAPIKLELKFSSFLFHIARLLLSGI